MWRVTHVQTEDDWTKELLATVLATPTPNLPSREARIGGAKASWFETEPGTAMIMTSGGTVDDRVLAEAIVRHDLALNGIKQAKFTFTQSEFVKTADWDDIMAKAKRLIQSGGVTLLRNGYNAIVGHVIGDHGQYQTEIAREDPNSQAITQWQCDCPWDQYAWQRTRQWKKYEGRCCSHVLATYWLSHSQPLDEDISPPDGGMRGQSPSINPGGGGGFGAPGGGAPIMGAPPSQGPPAGAGGAPLGVQGPTDPASLQLPSPPPQLLPTPPTEQQMPPPVSIPGGQVPTPYNPVQYPGGTYSKLSATFNNGDMVQLKAADEGELFGPAGSGGKTEIPMNSIGEVMGMDSFGIMVDVIFTGPAANNGPMEAYYARGWFFPTQLIARPDIAKPGPAIRRRQ